MSDYCFPPHNPTKMSATTISSAKPQRCKAALVIKGAHYQCEEQDGHGITAPGLPGHSNSEAEAVWK